MDWKTRIVEAYGQEYIFWQTAEEAAELCQASLKVVRVMNCETPVKWTEAQNRLLEEIADMEVMLDLLKTRVLTFEANQTIARIYAEKENRMRMRMIEEETP